MVLGDYIKDKLIANLKFEPTTCQLELFEALSDYFSGTLATDILVVNGYAGTGKTSAIGAFVALLKEYKHKFVLLAPTGRAAKVLSSHSSGRAYTVHKKIYREKDSDGGYSKFVLDFNKEKDTFYIVDEASLITNNTQGGGSVQFGSGDLLEDLIRYVRQGQSNKLILLGDDAQLPPIGLEKSPALDLNYLGYYGDIKYVRMTSVVRQALDSGILYNATNIRRLINKLEQNLELDYLGPLPNIDVKFPDIFSINGGELIESLESAYSKFGADDVAVLCRSNKRANRYNEGIRGTILFKEEKVSRGDKLMIVKNCYQFMGDVEDLDFIANGDVGELVKISKFEERYGLNFAEAIIRFSDYDDIEITAKVVLDTLSSESASLSRDQYDALYRGVFEDYKHIKDRKKRNAAIKEDPFFNALQIKYASAITCHKSQGGQWGAVFIDTPFWKEEVTIDDLKWLYTALTRAVSRVYLVNYKNVQ